jgi:hypothetical protein
LFWRPTPAGLQSTAADTSPREQAPAPVPLIAAKSVQRLSGPGPYRPGFRRLPAAPLHPPGILHLWLIPGRRRRRRPAAARQQRPSRLRLRRDRVHQERKRPRRPDQRHHLRHQQGRRRRTRTDQHRPVRGRLAVRDRSGSRHVRTAAERTDRRSRIPRPHRQITTHPARRHRPGGLAAACWLYPAPTASPDSADRTSPDTQDTNEHRQTPTQMNVALNWP